MVQGSEVQGFSAAVGLKSGQFNRKETNREH